MGAYLSEPNTKKESSYEETRKIAYGASSMQGWRVNQEDAHNCCINFDEDVSLFAVYDGHGGHEVAAYCANNLPNFIKQTEAYKKGDIRQALIDAFLGFDATLTKPEVFELLKELAGISSIKNDDLSESDEEENITNLCMEATMPLDIVMAKYQTKTLLKDTKNEKYESKCALLSPYLCSRRQVRDKASCSSSGAGCSSTPQLQSSSSSWNTKETDVSSSSQPCGSTLSSTVEQKESDCPGSNEAEQILDSTTSNGSVHASPSITNIETVKSMDMPDSSEDIKEKVSSPGKVSPCAESNVSEVEFNGAKPIGDVDSSKGGGDNVSSSSCTPVENGDADQQERITSSDPSRRKNKSLNLFNLLQKHVDDSEEDDDDEDITFDDAPSIYLKNDEEVSDEEESSEGEEEEDDEDEDEDEDEDDDEDEDKDKDSKTFNDFNNYSSNIAIEKPGIDSGCTAVVAILKGNDLYVANAGDSRCVLCRDSKAFELSQDHKPEDLPEMQRIKKAGGEVTNDGRVNGGLNLSRALGDHMYKQNTRLPPQEQMISALPDIRHVTLDPTRDDFMLLACDGIWNFMSSECAVTFVRERLSRSSDARSSENLAKICEELFDYCLAPNTFGDGTGCDNMTAILIVFKFPSAKITESIAAAKIRNSPEKRLKSEDDCTEENVIENPCKRSKIETAM